MCRGLWRGGVTGLALWMVGCSNGDVRLVKDSVWPGLPDTTIGKALDTRQACAETEWRAFDDERGRRIVEYRCEYRNARDYFERKTEEQIAEWSKSEQVQLQQFQRRVEEARGRSSEAQERLAQQELASQAPQEASQAKAVADLSADLAQLESMADCRDFRTAALQGIGALTMLRRAAADCVRGEPRAETVYANLRGSHIQSVQRALRQAEAEEKSRRAGLRIGYEMQRQYVAREQALLQQLEGSQAQVANEIRAASAKKTADAQLRLKDFRRVSEVTQWSVVRGDVVHVVSAIELLFDSRTLRDSVGERDVIQQARTNPEGITAPMSYSLSRLWANYSKSTPVASGR